MHNSLYKAVNAYLHTVLVAATLRFDGEEMKSSIEEARKPQCRKVLSVPSQRGTMTHLFWSTVEVLDFLFTFMHLADGFIQSDSWRAFWPPAFTVEHNSLQFQHVSLFISYVSSVVKTMLKNLHVSCTSPLVSKFPSEDNVYRPQYPSRLRKEVSWSQISCIVSFPQKRARLPISHSSSDQVMKCRHMRKVTGIFILELFLFPWRTHCEKVLVRSNHNPLLELHSG